MTHNTRAQLGQYLYLQFDKVIILKVKKRIMDCVWNNILLKLREGACEMEDLQEIWKLILGSPDCDKLDFDSKPWSEAILITSQHGIRTQWNTASLHKHVIRTGHQIYILPAEDVYVNSRQPILMSNKMLTVGMTLKQTAKTAERVELLIGMKAMVIINIVTEADLANGTRGRITYVHFDP